MVSAGISADRSASCPGVLVNPNSDAAEMMMPMFTCTGRICTPAGRGASARPPQVQG